MTQAGSHSAVVRDWRVLLLDVRLTTRAGTRVGGPSDRVDTDLPVHRDHQGVPMIPGSSLKGSLRSLAERLLAARRGPLGRPLACDILTDPCFGAPDRTLTDDELAQRCWCCTIFGCPHAAGLLHVGDLHADTAATVVRDGVGIDRDELKAHDGIKYDYEVVVPDTVFTGRWRLDDPHDGDLGLLIELCALASDDLLFVGGGASRGLGRVTLDVTGVRELVASRWQPGDEPRHWTSEEFAAERARAATRIDELPECALGEER